MAITHMNTEEIKLEIQKSLDKVPDSVLQDVLNFLKFFEKQSAEKLTLAIHLNTILKEDRELLERLAK